MPEKLHMDTSIQLMFDLGMIGRTQKFRRKTFTGLSKESAQNTIKIQQFTKTIAKLQTKPLFKTILMEKNEIR